MRKVVWVENGDSMTFRPMMMILLQHIVQSYTNRQMRNSTFVITWFEAPTKASSYYLALPWKLT
jgi:hypothetical protein